MAGSGPHRAGRHRVPGNPRGRGNPQRRQAKTVVAGAAVVLFAGFAGLTAYTGLTGSRDAAGAQGPADPLPATPGSLPCTRVRVLASYENAPLLSALASAYRGAQRDIAGHCVALTVSPSRTGLAAADAASGFGRMPTPDRPTIWAPDSTAWLDLARRPAAQAARPVVLPQRAPSIARTPIMIAMPRPRAAALGWPDLHPTWRDYFGAGADGMFWARHGHPEWGPFRVGRASPEMTSSGLYGLLAEYAALAGHPGTVRAEEMSDPRLAGAVRRAELANVHYAASDDHFAWRNRQAEDSGDIHGLISGLTTTEKTLWDYNRGVISEDGVTQQRIAPPGNPLVPVYPRDGTFFVDCPLSVLEAPWVDAQQRAAAADFVRFAQT
ncbi:MAG TPA: substrate-binding domain-containing protein, partial [Pseudonocardiaceae bacterium]|nr:substrate-binding domain-containing protein [Pseudonocardiaceae bacterium]